MKHVVLVPLSFFVLTFFAPRVHAIDNDTCASCHSQGLPDIPSVDQNAITHSMHGKLECVACHRDVQEVPHPEKPKPVSCKACHRLESEIYLQSDHGKALSKGRTEAATCVSCHGAPHNILSARNPASPVHRSHLPNTCATCHADIDRMKNIRLTEKEPYETYIHSVHGEAYKKGKTNAAICSDCHGTHDLHGPTNPLSKINRANIPTTCGKCHENVSSVYKLSVHGTAMAAGIKEAPVCTDCHGEHTIKAISDPQSSVYVGEITKTCSGCHESQKIVAKFGLPSNRLSSYQNSYHGLASRLGDLRAANCASCHGWHDILPSSDPRSSVYSANLTQTCGKCHSGANVKLLSGKVHGDAGTHEHPMIHWVKLFYLFIIPLTLGFMILHNFLDYFRKALDMDKPSHMATHEVNILRLNTSERWQHALLMITFIMLAVSGFALKFPGSWWALPFSSGGEVLRKLVHRTAALIFLLTSVWHILYMAFTDRGRLLMKRNLRPRMDDLFDPFRAMLFNIGLRKTRPVLRYPSYIEKMEYWALVWGSMIMIVSGSVLYFNDLALKYFPVWASNFATLIHFYEALLACLAILVWHFYWSIFDPAVYPMNWAWLFGRLRRPTKKKESHDDKRTK